MNIPVDATVEFGLPDTLATSERVGDVELVKIPAEYKLESGNEEIAVPVTGAAVTAPLELA